MDDDIHKDDGEGLYTVDIPDENVPGLQELYAEVGDKLFPKILFRLHYAGNATVKEIAEEIQKNMMDLKDQAHDVYETAPKPPSMSDIDAGIGLGISVAIGFFISEARNMLPMDIDFDEYAEKIKDYINQHGSVRH